MPDLIVAALIAGSVNAFGLVLQGWWFSTRIERLKLVGAERLANLEHTLAAFAKHRDNHNDVLARLLRAASIAHSAAKGIVAESETKSGPALMSILARAFQDISVFLKEAREARSNVYLKKEELALVDEVQAAVLKLFSALDLDAGGDRAYQQKLANCFKTLNGRVDAFGEHVRGEIRPKHSKHSH